MSAYLGVDDTRAIQKALKAKGYEESAGHPLVVDGQFGGNTRRALFHCLGISQEEAVLPREEGKGDLIKTLRGRRINLTQHYGALLENVAVRGNRVGAVNAIVDRIVQNQQRYTQVARVAGVPWYVIACLHNMEASGSFGKHLHEGSPLTGRTRWVPKGRPKEGNPPFAWETSALDALQYDGLTEVKDWSLINMLWTMERYNGTGYLRYHQDVPSPYLWSFSSVYTSGKYVSDGRWDQNAVSQQCGCVPILKVLKARDLIAL